MSYCPECGKLQGHLHLGWNKNVCGTKIECDSCGTTTITFRFKKKSKTVDELYKTTDDFINPSGARPCSISC